jgi:hydrogenase nickel incorporation protein HypA/HybF
MHELPVTQSILDVALTHARQAGAQRVLGVNLVLSAASHESEDSLRFYWEMLSADTLAHGALLHFRHVPVELSCLECNTVFSAETAEACPACLSPRIILHSGDDLRVESIDVE